MNRIPVRRILVQWSAAAACILGAALHAEAATSPASLMVKVFEMRVSTHSDCSTWSTVFKTDNPTQVDLVNQPLLGTGLITNGTYHCLMFHISDLISVIPQTTDGLCAAGFQYNIDFFHNTTVEASITPEGAHIDATAGQDNPWLFFSDGPDAAPGNNCFRPTLACACGAPCPMSPFTVGADVTHSLVINFDNQVGDFGGPTCTLHSPAITIR